MAHALISHYAERLYLFEGDVQAMRAVLAIDALSGIAINAPASGPPLFDRLRLLARLKILGSRGLFHEFTPYLAVQPRRPFSEGVFYAIVRAMARRSVSLRRKRGSKVRDLLTESFRKLIDVLSGGALLVPAVPWRSAVKARRRTTSGRDRRPAGCGIRSGHPRLVRG